MQFVIAVVGAALFAVVPMQSRHVASAVSVQSFDACTGLSREECCEQTLKTAGFRALGERLPKSARQMAKLSCQGAGHVMPAGACRSIATSRGFAHGEVASMCKPPKLRTRCKRDGECKKCVSDLEKLSYSKAESACYAVTHLPERPGTAVVVVRRGDTSRASEGYELRTSRSRLR